MLAGGVIQAKREASCPFEKCQKKMLRDGKLNWDTSWWLKTACPRLTGLTVGKVYVIPVENVTSLNWHMSSEHTGSQLMRECMCEAGGSCGGAKKEPARQTRSATGGPATAGPQQHLLSEFLRKIYPLLSQIVEDLGRCNPWRTWLVTTKRGDLPETSIPGDHKRLSEGEKKYARRTHESSQSEGESDQLAGNLIGQKVDKTENRIKSCTKRHFCTCPE